MKTPNAIFLEALAELATASPPSLEEKMFYIDQAEADAHEKATATVPTMYKNTLQLEPVMLRSGLFRPGHGLREKFYEYTEIPTAGAHRIEFKGEELRQDDQRVLLVLLKMRAGKRIDEASERLNLRRFCVQGLGWADSGVSVEKLRACLARLHDARVRVHYAAASARPGQAPRPVLGLYSFVSSVVYEGSAGGSDGAGQGGFARVALSYELVRMFERSVTFLKQDRRLALGDGLSSWLWAYLQADTCHHEINLEGLRRVACKENCSQKDFNKNIRAAAAELVSAGLLERVDFVNGTEQRGRAMRVRKLG